MSEDDILRMAREAGGAWEYNRSHPVPCVMYDEELIRFARLVAAAERNRTWTQKHWTEYERGIVAAEREACARICEQAGIEGYGTLAAAAMIRARGEK